MHPIAFRAFFGWIGCIGVICAAVVFAAFIENALRKDTACNYGYGFAIVVGVGICVVCSRYLMRLPRWDQVGYAFFVELWLESLGLIILGAAGLADVGMQLCGGYQLNSIVACVATMCLLLGIPLFLWVFFVTFTWFLGADSFFGFVTCRSCRSDSTVQFTSDSRPHEIDFITVGNGKIGMCIAPGRIKGRWNRSLEADLNRIHKDYNTDVLVTLLTQADFIDIQTPHLLESVRSHGLQSIHAPIRDKFIPANMEEFTQLVNTLVHLLRRGKTVVVHCNGGKGRTGLVVAAVLIATHGCSVSQAIDAVRAARAGTLYNPLQIFYAYQFASYWHENLLQNTLPLVIDLEHQ